MCRNRTVKKRTTHKAITNAVHLACLVAAVYIFAVWQKGTVVDAPQMLQYVAWVEITNLAQYSAKSGYEHKHGIFDSAVAQAAIQGMQSGDLSAAKQVAEAVEQAVENTGNPPAEGTNNNMAG